MFTPTRAPFLLQMSSEALPMGCLLSDPGYPALLGLTGS